MEWGRDGKFVKLPAISKEVTDIQTLSSGRATLEQEADHLMVSLAKKHHNPIATPIVLTVSGNAFDIEPRAVQENNSLTYNKPVEASNVFRGRIEEYGPSKAVDGRMNTRWATDADALTPSITIDLKEEKRIGHVRIDEAYAGRIQTHALQYRVNGQWKTIYRGGTVGADFSRSFEPVRTRRVRLNVLKATRGPTIYEIRLYETGK